MSNLYDARIVSINEDEFKIEIETLNDEDELIVTVYDTSVQSFCRECGYMYPGCFFKVTKSGKFNKICKTCCKKVGKKKREKSWTNKTFEEKIKAKYKGFQRNNKHEYLYNKLNYINYNDYKQLILGNCYYCGREPNPFNGIDRILNEFKYVKGNCVSCCWQCNKMKSNLSIESFSKQVTRIYENFANDVIVLQQERDRIIFLKCNNCARSEFKEMKKMLAEKFRISVNKVTKIIENYKQHLEKGY